MAFSLETIIEISAIIGTAVTAIVTISRYALRQEMRLQILSYDNQRQDQRLDAALQLLDKRIRDLEKHSAKQSGFEPHHKRHEQTGAPWLDD